MPRGPMCRKALKSCWDAGVSEYLGFLLLLLLAQVAAVHVVRDDFLARGIDAIHQALQSLLQMVTADRERRPIKPNEQSQINGWPTVQERRTWVLTNAPWIKSSSARNEPRALDIRSDAVAHSFSSSINPWNVTRQPRSASIPSGALFKYFHLRSHAAHILTSTRHKNIHYTLSSLVAFFFFCTSTFTPSTFGIYPDNKSALLYTARVKLHSEYIIIICLLIGRRWNSACKPITHTPRLPMHWIPNERLIREGGEKKRSSIFLCVFHLPG